MEYVCLAAGPGTRFGELGRYLQKAMYPVGLRPFLEHTLLQWLEGAAVDARRHDRLTLVVGHFDEQLRGYFGASFEGVPLRYVAQSAQRGTGHALGVGVDALPDETEAVVAWLADLFVPAQAFRACWRIRPRPWRRRRQGDPGREPAAARPPRGRAADRVWDGEGPWLDVGLWRLPLPRGAGLRRVSAEKGEYRLLPNLQEHVDEGLEVGWLPARRVAPPRRRAPDAGGERPARRASGVGARAVIAARTPLRIPLGGGLTDLRAYAERFGGVTISSTIGQAPTSTVLPPLGGASRCTTPAPSRPLAASTSSGTTWCARRCAPRAWQRTRCAWRCGSTWRGESGLGASGAITVAVLQALAAYRGERVTRSGWRRGGPHRGRGARRRVGVPRPARLRPRRAAAPRLRGVARVPPRGWR
jgi:CTP:molybdopterin cytidylyltransferase MocA